MTVILQVDRPRHIEDDFHLDPVVLQALWRMEDRHFWHGARNGWILQALKQYGKPPPGTFLEVGCGGGAVARVLLARGYSVVGVDTAEPLIRKANDRCPQGTFVVGAVSGLPREACGPFEAIGLFDVLEHLDDPALLLRECLRYAAPGALILATVPAFQSLYTILDSLSGHKKRYEPGELAALFRGVGLDSVHEHGIFRAGLPLLRLQRRRIGDRGRLAADTDSHRFLFAKMLKVPSSPANLAMRTVCFLERVFGFGFSEGKAGGSLLAVGVAGAGQAPLGTGRSR